MRYYMYVIAYRFAQAFYDATFWLQMQLDKLTAKLDPTGEHEERMNGPWPE